MLQSLLAEVLQVPVAEVHDDLVMDDVDAWDSLTHMELVVSLESAFQLELSFDEIVEMTTVEAIKRVLVEKGVVL